VFAKAGLVFRRNPVSALFLGISAAPSPSGGVLIQAVTPGSAAAEAGIEPGDVLTRIGDIPVSASQDWGTAFRSRYQGKVGQPLAITVQRAGSTLTLNTTVRERTTSRLSLDRAPNPTPKQAKIWQSLASGL